MVTKFKKFDIPSGARNPYYSKDVNGGTIDLKDVTNVKILSKRHLSKKQSDTIKMFAKKSYK